MRGSRLGALLAAGLTLGCGGDDDDGGDGGIDPTADRCVPGRLGLWSRSERGVGGAVSFNELMIHPAGAAPEWIELHNPLAIDFDVSGFRIAGAIELEFPEGSRIPPRGYAVVGSSGDVPASLGVFAGQLPDDGGELELWNNAGRLLDVVRYGDGEPWPVAPDGSGASLAKATPGTASEPAESWRASAAVGGSPGAANPTTATGLAFNEVGAGGGGDGVWLELVNLGATTIELGGHRIASSAGGEHVLADGALAPGALLALDADALGVDAAAGDALFLFAPARAAVLDAVRIDDVPRARRAAAPDRAQAWGYPDRATPGAVNVFPTRDGIAIAEILYHAAPASEPDGTIVEPPLEWIELWNHGDAPVDVGGWQLVDAAAAQLPTGLVVPADGRVVVTNDADALAATYPDLDAIVVDGLRGRLADAGDRIVLRDACGNTVDEVPYEDGGAWPERADGGGSTLELRDPRADNSVPGAWAASDETAAAAWQTIAYQGAAAPSSVGPDGTWHELVLGLLDAGEVLIDDVSVVVDPAGAATELVAGGDFEAGAAAFRLRGNHRHGEVIEDPTAAGNHVLRLVATGPTEHMHNHVETTLAGGHAIANGQTYRVSLRARWRGGSNLLNTRLYFNRLARTTALAVPGRPGTPGAANRAATPNLGPTFRDLRHAPVTPQAGEPVAVAVAAADPDGVAGLTLAYAVSGGAPTTIPMVDQGDGRFAAAVPGAAAGAVVQVWVEGEDARGARATFPAAGAASRVLWRVADGADATGALPIVRVVMTPADAAWLFEPKNLMSNDLVGATVVVDGVDVYPDVRVRLKSSQRGRTQSARVGFAIVFDPARPFRGVHGSVLVDRSQGTGFGQRELFFFQAMNHAGGVTSQYDDLIQVRSPRPEHAGSAHLQLERYGNGYFDAQFGDGGDGALFEYELVYYPTTTDSGTATGNKLPQPDSVVGTAIRDLGDDEEAYRLAFIVKNHRWRDDFRGLIGFARVFGQTGAAFDAEVGDAIDVDQWLRTLAFANLSGATDNYASGAQHNAEFYVRPSDGRVLYLQHDLDFLGSARSPVVGSGDLAKLIGTPARARAYYGHLRDIIATSYNATYMAAWATQFGALLPGQDFAAHRAFVAARAEWVMTTAPNSVTTAIPSVGFAITTNGGAPLAVEAATVALAGTGWIDVHRIAQAGGAADLSLAWPTTTTWTTTVPVPCGSSTIQLDAFDRRGDAVGGDSIAVTRTGAMCP